MFYFILYHISYTIILQRILTNNLAGFNIVEQFDTFDHTVFL
jgi:hypothetical protein